MYDKEVTWVTCFFNNRKLKIQTLPHLIGNFGVFAFSPFISKMTQIIVFTFFARRVVFYLQFFGDIKLRHEDITRQAIGLYLVDNFLNIENRLRNILEERLHFGGSFEIILVVRHPETITTTASDRCFLFFAVFHTQQNIVGIGIFFMEIEGIVGSDEFHPVFFGKLYKGFVYAVFIFLVVAHHL